MSRTTQTRPPSKGAERRITDRRRRRVAPVLAVGVVAIGAVLFASATGDDPSASPAQTAAVSGLPLPNPMGGPAQHAPAATGDAVSLGGLRIVAPDVHMGDVPLNVTVVPTWTVVNPTDVDVTLTVGQPQVHQGCCPGPVYVDEVLTPAGTTVTIPAGGDALVQFPLQMHPGMDGPHHLTVPLAADGRQAELHVTGDFAADA